MFEKGDLVMVVKPTPCCNTPIHMGLVYTIDSVRTDTVRCIACNRKMKDELAVYKTALYGGAGYLTSMLKKIDPLPIEEEKYNAEPIHEPA